MLELNAVYGRVYAFEITSNITAVKCTKMLELNAVFGRVYAFEITLNLTAVKCTKTSFTQGSLEKQYLNRQKKRRKLNGKIGYKSGGNQHNC